MGRIPRHLLQQRQGIQPPETPFRPAPGRVGAWGRRGLGLGRRPGGAEVRGSLPHPLTAAGTSAFSSLQGGWGAFVCLAGALESGGKGEWQRGGERCRNFFGAARRVRGIKAGGCRRPGGGCRTCLSVFCCFSTGCFVAFLGPLSHSARERLSLERTVNAKSIWSFCQPPHPVSGKCGQSWTGTHEVVISDRHARAE